MESLSVAGFKFAAACAGIKNSDKNDCAIIVSDVPAACAGVFTQNKVVAAPVVITKPRIAAGRCQAIIVNSGNANACTGATGIDDAVRCAAAVAQQLDIDDELVAVSSTGVIGVPLPAEKLISVVPALCDRLGRDEQRDVAEAIMTTDSFSKVAESTLTIGGQQCTVSAVAKGAGMIHPNMATMLAFVVTDANVARSCCNLC